MTSVLGAYLAGTLVVLMLSWGAGSGAETPRATYERLARERLARRVDWARVHIVWGDERCVAPSRADSNFRMAFATLLDHVPIPTANVHRIRGEDPPDRAAGSYEVVLRNLLRTSGGLPSSDPERRIDLVLLGLGENGHTASLFPESPALDEMSRWVVAAHTNAAPAWRDDDASTAQCSCGAAVHRSGEKQGEHVEAGAARK